MRGRLRFLSVVLLWCSGSVCASDVTFEELLYQALESHPAIQSRLATKESAQSDLLAAKLRFLPTPSVTTLRNRVRYTNSNVSPDPATTLSLTQPLFMGGALFYGYQKSSAKLDAADYGWLETRDDVAKRVSNAYADWWRSYIKVKALEDSQMVHEKMVGLVSRRNAAGVSSSSDQDLAMSRLYQVNSELDASRSAERVALSTLSELVGYKLSRTQLMNRIAQPLLIPDRSIGLTQALELSPTINRIKHEADAAEAEAKEVRGKALPQISAMAQRQIGNATVPGWPSYNQYGINIAYSPDAGFSSFASTGAAFDRARAARLQIEAAKREITEKLSADYDEYESTLKRRKELSKSASLAGGVSESYDRQYLAGRKSWLDLMNAIREKTQMKQALADADASCLASSLRLAVAIYGAQMSVDPSSSLK